MPAPARWRLRTALAWQEVRVGEPWRHDNRRRTGGACIFQYTRRGALALRAGSRRLDVPPGCAALMRFGDDSAYAIAPAAGDYACTYVTLLGAGLAEHWRELIALHGPCVPYGEDVLARALALIAAAEPARATPAGVFAGLVHAFVMDLYDRVRAPGGGERPAAERAIDAILADPAHALSLKEVARRHGLSREHLARAFRRRCGVPPWTWITRQRLERARSLLADTGLPVAEVARRCGYASARVLARNLVDRTGRPPSAWRRRPR